MLDECTRDRCGIATRRCAPRVADAAARAAAAKYSVPAPSVGFEAPRRPEFGDFATNVAFSLAKSARRSPQRSHADSSASCAAPRRNSDEAFSRVEAVAGFINLRLAPAVWQAVVARILREGERFGEAPQNGERISLEFGSANPTGPLVVVQGRTLSIGDALARAMRMRGYDVFIEWIINDAGAQIDTLGRSLYARYRQTRRTGVPVPGRRLSRRLLDPDRESAFASATASEWIAAPKKRVAAVFHNGSAATRSSRSSSAPRERFGVRYDLWQSEQELHDTGTIRDGIERLRELGLTYEKDGALWFRATAFRRRQGSRASCAATAGRRTFALRRRLSLRETAARRPRDRHSRSRSSRLHRAPARARERRSDTSRARSTC